MKVVIAPDSFKEGLAAMMWLMPFVKFFTAMVLMILTCDSGAIVNRIDNEQRVSHS
ncbi:hypothetical protein [Fictibacillus sp. S7]|uniref:hypothetical protein n=1 Tax=Fictibacillus sp. S7 TaxID=2212476 RepID=UPI0013E9883E|nr:hypothetical protein [Fictibacillus sp. S7]